MSISQSKSSFDQPKPMGEHMSTHDTLGVGEARRCSMLSSGKYPDLLGMKPRKAETPLTLAVSVQNGLPVSALVKFAGGVSPQDARRFTYRVVPKPTLERRRKEKQPLSTEGGV